MYKRNEYICCGDYYELKILYKKDTWYTFYIDTEDYEKVSARRWRTQHKKQKVYAISGNTHSVEGAVYLHNFIMNYKYKKGYEVDHINGNEKDNRKSNLRIVTRLENIQNMNAKNTNKLGIRGITYNPNWHLYVVDFSFNKKRFYFPHWKTLEEAVYCRKFAEEYFGLETLNRNVIAQEHLTLPQAKQDEIKNIVLQILRK